MTLEFSRSISVSWRLRLLFTEDVFSPSNPVLANLLRDEHGEPTIALYLDEGTLGSDRTLLESAIRYCAQSNIRLAFDPVVLPGGEHLKNDQIRLSTILNQMLRSNLCRHSYVIALGGGALLDLVGFAAATAHRGLRHIRLPSTTLAQADSGVGVKNGINAYGQKNAIGTFAPPFAIINDLTLLRNLPYRHRIGGLSEAVKVALVRDAAFFTKMEELTEALQHWEPEAVRATVQRSAELHLDHIATSGDPFELGTSRPLDFGHWSAHKLESLSGFTLTHGESVAIGIALDTIYSQRMGWIPEASVLRILELLRRLGFRLFAPELLVQGTDGRFEVLQGIEEFRQHLGGRLTLTMLHEIGRPHEVHAVDLDAMEQAIVALESLGSGSSASQLA